MIKRIISGFIAVVSITPVILASFLAFSPLAHADSGYNPSFLISDPIFSNSNSMNWIDIQNFLNAQNSGLKNYSDVENCSSIKTPYSYTFYPHCGSTESAAVIIYDAGQAYGINPQAIIATLQKEQSLITTPNPTQSQINCAMGYNSCSGFSGFFSQVDNGAWQLRTYIELMNNRNWWGYTPASYPCKNASSLYSAGLYPGATVTFADPGGSARTVTMGSSATAALYCYTPYVGPYNETGYSGSYNFVISFETWFGSIGLTSCLNENNVSPARTGANIIPYRYNNGSVTNYALIIPNNTGSACVESHGLSAPDGHFFISHVATGMKATDPASGQILPFQAFQNSGDTLLYVNYGSGSTNVNMHVFSPDLSTMPGYYDTSTNLGSTNSGNGMFVTGDFFGRGGDQVAYILYSGSSGHVEVHMCDPTLTRCVGYYDVATNLPAMTATQGTFVAGDFLGRGYDQLAFILYNGASGHVEVHLFDPSLQHGSGFYDVPTNITSFNPATGSFIAGKFLGRNDAQLALVLYDGTGSGNVEIHLFDPTLERGSGYYDTVTTLSSFDPTQ